MKRPEFWGGPAPEIERALMQGSAAQQLEYPLYAEIQEET
jgi:hypothetical protein